MSLLDIARGLVFRFALIAMSVAFAPAPTEAFAQDARVPTIEEAPIALLVDLSSGQVLYSRNPDRRFAPASITKVMTLMLAFEKMREGALSPARNVRVSEEIDEEWGRVGSSMRLEAGDVVSVHELLLGIANGSANDASVVLAVEAAGSVENWTEQMTEKGRQLGLTQSRFGTPNGWPDEGKTFVTARDLVRLADAMISQHPGKYETYVGRRAMTYKGYTRRNRDPLIDRFAGADGIKTGFTNEAGFGYLGSVKRGDQRLAMVVAGSYTTRERNAAARALMEWGFSNFDRRPVFDKSARVGAARVQNGSRRYVNLETDQAVHVNIPQNASAELELKINYNGPLRAPIMRGAQVAKLTITAPGVPSAQIPLFASEDVKEAGFIERIINGIAGWFA